MERLIREIFLRKGSGFVLKGGGALRTLFGGQRLTKDIDLDFTNPKRTADSLHTTVSRCIRNAARGLPLANLEVSVPGKAETTPRWKINFTDPDNRRYHVEIEVSRDPARAAPGNVVQKPFTPEAAIGIARFWADIYDEPALIATKLAALLGRGLPRDVYDLDTLIRASAHPVPEQIRWAIERANLKGENAAEVLHARMDALTWERYQTELRDSLTEQIADRIDKTEWSGMKSRVGQYAERLLQDATG